MSKYVCVCEWEVVRRWRMHKVFVGDPKELNADGVGIIT